MSFRTELELHGRQVLVAGGGPAALASISAVLEAGGRVTVIAPVLATSVSDLAARALLVAHRRELIVDDLAGAALVIPASGAADQDRRAADLAAAAGVPAVSVPSAEPMPRIGPRGSVVLVGGGPGDPGLLTIAGLEAIQAADVLVCDRLAPLAALEHAAAGTEIIDVAKIPRGEFTSQQRINEILVEQARAGKTVVRLKGGDSFVFGRGGEEWQACAAAGIPVRVIPGVSSALAGPALAGIPLTHRQLTQGFTVVSGHLPPGDPGSTLDWAALARVNTTLVILMGVATLPAISRALLGHGLAADTPAATVADAGLPSQRTVRGTLADIAQRTAQTGIRPPAITVIGAVVDFSPVLGTG